MHKIIISIQMCFFFYLFKGFLFALKTHLNKCLEIQLMISIGKVMVCGIELT